jgi:phytoene dehydrogenase-like protein
LAIVGGIKGTTDNSVIIVGGGHNGLVTAGYLARAGLKVQVLERRERVGGAAVTEEWFPGFHISTCSYMCHALQKKVIDDLELRKYGFHVYTMDPGRTHLFPDGQSVRFWHDADRCAEEIRGISSHDADAWPQWIDFWNRAMRVFSEYYLTPPPSLAEVMDRFREDKEEELLHTLLTVPLKDLIERFFDSPQIMAMVCAAGGDQGDITAPGSAFSSAFFKFAGFRKDKENYGIVRGGMGAITQSMAHSAEAHGASIRTDAEVKRILTEAGRATGVELANGEILAGDIVVSNADPKRTFGRLLDSADMDDAFLADVESLETQAASIKLHCALKELPDLSKYLGASFEPKDIALMTICPSVEYYQNSWEDAKNGRVSRSPLIQVQVPTVYDSTVAEAGQHILSMWVTYEPPHLKDGSWADVRREAGDQLIDVFAEYVPNIRDAILDWKLLTPEDMETRVGLTDGNIRHLDMTPQQVLNRRPLPGWSDYRTPIEGLYLCGSGTHPGGEVTGAPGHNAAQVILSHA